MPSIPFLQVKLTKPGNLPGLILYEADGYYIVTSLDAHEPTIKLRIREAYPVTFAHQTDEGVIVGYGPRNPTPMDEFLHITLTTQGVLTVRRDVYATLPIFYGESGDVFALSNQYAFVTENLPQLTASRTAVQSILMCNADSQATLWDEISILNERYMLEIGQQKSVVHKPEARSWISSKQAKPTDAGRFRATLAAHFDTFIEHFVRDGFAFEVSGGIDSTLLPLYYAKTHPNGPFPPFGSMIFPGGFAASQLEKLEVLTALGFYGVKVAVNPTTDYPLSRIISGGLEPYYCFQEVYTEVTQRLAAQLAHQGVKVIASGTGGDELFENTHTTEEQLGYGEIERQSRSSAAYPPFFTKSMREEYIAATPNYPPYPLPLLSVSLYGAGLARNNIYIEQGIWPVLPYADVQLYEYCQGLPASVRANKRILRAFCATYDLPQIIYSPKQNEHFGTFFEEALLSGNYGEFAAQLATSSVAAGYGFVDTDAVLKMLQGKGGLMDANKQWLLHILEWMSAEANLQCKY